MDNPRDPNLPRTRSTVWVVAAVALAILIGLLYYVVTVETEEGVELDGPADVAPAGGDGAGGAPPATD